jgi:hypothetical protein
VYCLRGQLPAAYSNVELLFALNSIHKTYRTIEFPFAYNLRRLSSLGHLGCRQLVQEKIYKVISLSVTELLCSFNKPTPTGDCNFALIYISCLCLQCSMRCVVTLQCAVQQTERTVPPPSSCLLTSGTCQVKELVLICAFDS